MHNTVDYPLDLKSCLDKKSDYSTTEMKNPADWGSK